LYTYTSNNPLILVDPFGLCASLWDRGAEALRTGYETARNAFWEATADVTSYIPNSAGLSMRTSWVNPILDHVPGLRGYGNEIYGLDLQFFDNGNIDLYYFTTAAPGDDRGAAAGLDMSAFSLQGNMAWGRGEWAGDFISLAANGPSLSGDYFESLPNDNWPVTGWKGTSFGAGWGLPGGALEVTNYEPLGRTNIPEATKQTLGSGLLMPIMPPGF
jgi:hypothetical protein